MRYYAHYGHTDFILCLGYGAAAVKDFFLNYDETRSNDFVLERGSHEPTLFRTDISDWRITLVDTGLHSPIGERLRRVRGLLADETMFMANYADVLTDAPLPDMIERFTASEADGKPPGRPAAILAPCGGHRRRWCGHGRDADARPGSLGERRVLSLPTGDLRRAQRGRGSRRRRASSGWFVAAASWPTSTRVIGRLPTPSRSGSNSTSGTTVPTVLG